MSYPYALVINKSASKRSYVSHTLRFEAQIGHVVEAESPFQALRAMAENSGDLLCVVSDINTEDVSFSEFVQSLNKFKGSSLSPPPLFVLADDMSQCKTRDLLGSYPTAILRTSFKPYQLVGLIDAYVGENDRRRAKRIVPINLCDVSFDSQKGLQFYSAEVLNVSDKGILLECPLGIQENCGVYDLVRLTLHVNNGMSISLAGEMVRIEALSHGSEKFGYSVKVAINFCAMEDRFRDALNKYILLHEDESGAQH